MQILKTLFLFLVITVSLPSCYYDVEEELYPVTAGRDTSNVTLSGKVKPIIEGSCYACHSQTSAQTSGGGYNFESYAGLKSMVDNGKLIKAINHLPGASAMPKGSTSKIDACEIKVIEKWVTKGAKND